MQGDPQPSLPHLTHISTKKLVRNRGPAALLHHITNNNSTTTLPSSFQLPPPVKILPRFTTTICHLHLPSTATSFHLLHPFHCQAPLNVSRKQLGVYSWQHLPSSSPLSQPPSVIFFTPFDDTLCYLHYPFHCHHLSSLSPFPLSASVIFITPFAATNRHLHDPCYCQHLSSSSYLSLPPLVNCSTPFIVTLQYPFHCRLASSDPIPIQNRLLPSLVSDGGMMPDAGPKWRQLQATTTKPGRGHVLLRGGHGPQFSYRPAPLRAGRHSPP